MLPEVPLPAFTIPETRATFPLSPDDELPLLRFKLPVVYEPELDPDAKVMAPVPPAVTDDALDIVSAPDGDVVVVDPLTIEKLPEDEPVAAPAPRKTAPPVTPPPANKDTPPPVPNVLVPALTLSFPPVPEVAVPAESDMAPDAAVPLPVARNNAPDEPEVVGPELNNNCPESPEELFPLARVRLPEAADAMDEVPLEIETSPPEDDEALPAVIITEPALEPPEPPETLTVPPLLSRTLLSTIEPPVPVPEDPALTLTAPVALELALPLLIDTLPPPPVVAVPELIATIPDDSPEPDRT